LIFAETSVPAGQRLSSYEAAAMATVKARSISPDALLRAINVSALRYRMGTQRSEPGRSAMARMETSAEPGRAHIIGRASRPRREPTGLLNSQRDTELEPLHKMAVKRSF
jgi:hypothetical protein